MRTFGLLCVSLTLVLCVSGCPRRVELRTMPKDATVEVRKMTQWGDEKPLRLPDVRPLRYTFDFGKYPEYEVAVTKEGYRDKSVHLTEAVVEALPVPPDVTIPVLKVELEEAEYQELEKAEVVVDPEEGLVVRMRHVRAFEEDIEREGVPASKVVQLGKGLWITGITIAADGDRIAFAVVERAKDANDKVIEFSNIRAVNAGTGAGGITQLTMGRWMDIDPSFAASGADLYLASNRLRNTGLDLFRIKTTTKGGGIAVVHHQTDGWSRSPSEGAGGVLSFNYQPRYRGRAGTPQVWTIGGRSQYPTQLREGSQPRMSPDGTRIAFIGPDSKLWLLGTDAQAPVQLTTNPDTQEGEPAWTPDGTHLVYVSDEGKDNTGTANNDIWMMLADGTGRRQLTTNGSDDTTPVVDPQKRWIYFVSNRGYKVGIWRIPYPSDIN